MDPGPDFAGHAAMGVGGWVYTVITVALLALLHWVSGPPKQ